jgi:hypothetical protein
MDLYALFANLQLIIFILGTFIIVIAGFQDRKSRLAPAIYFAPTLIGFGLNIYLGVVGLVLTMLGLFFWKDEWNKSFGLADALLFLCLLMSMLSTFVLPFTIVITSGVLIELFLNKSKEKVPLVWLYAKWICITFTIFMLLSIAIGLGVVNG